jgi:arylsulfatase A-like enzyme
VALFNNPHHHPTSGFFQGFEEARLLDRDPDQAYARVDSVRDAFLDWHANRDPSRPFFAYLHLMEPHNPYRPPEAYRELFPPGPGRYEYVNGTPSLSFSDQDLAHMRALYSAEIRTLDDGLRAVIGELERRGVLDRTLVVVTADHGEELMDHGGLGHGKTVELEQLRIPLVMAGGPARGAAGRRVGELVRNLDLAPTLVELAGVEVPPEFEGESLLPLLAGPSTVAVGRTRSFAWNAKLRALTSSTWHCMRDLEDDRLTLYHRPSDPAGMNDVAVGHPRVAELCRTELDRLEGLRLESVRRANRLKALETAGPETEQVREQLEALGYVER